MNEDFTEEEFEDELPEGVEFAEPAPNPKARPAQAPRVAPAEPNLKRKPAPAAPAAAEALTERFTPFLMPERIGVLDNETQQPLMEDKDTNTLLLGLITKLLNDVDDIKKNL